MKEKEIEHNRLYRKKYKIAVVIFLIVLVGVIFSFPLICKWISPSKSEIEIRKAVAAQLQKDPDKLTKKDFENIEALTFNNNLEISDITFLKNFTNIKYLDISYLRYSLPRIPKDTPKWKILLDKLGIVEIPKSSYTPPWMNNERLIIDITPLKKLKKLEMLDLKATWVKSIDPLTHLENLKELDLSQNNLSDIEPLKKMKNLKMIDLTGSEKLTIEQIQDLQEALPDLIINYNNYLPPWLKNNSNIIGTQE